MVHKHSALVSRPSRFVPIKGLIGTGLSLMVLSLSLGACEQDPIASEATATNAEKRSNGTAANPVLVFEGRESYRGGKYSTIAVMDSTGENKTDVVLSRDLGERQSLQWPDWSPDGKSICFRQSYYNDTARADHIRTFDLSLSSSGKPTASTTRLIYSPANGDGVNEGLAWSKTSAVNQIAFTTYNHQKNAIGSLWTIPASGGTPKRIWGADGVKYVKEDGSKAARTPLTCPTWSPDDTRLAVVRNDSALTSGTERVNTIMIFSTTDGGNTWSYTDSIKLTGTGYPNSMLAHGLEWSRNANDVDKLIWSDHGSSTIYYCSPTTGATPTTNSVSGRYPDWSPDNKTIIFHNVLTGYIARMPAFGTSVTDFTTVTTTPRVRWK